jgi:hypothetical protein
MSSFLVLRATLFMPTMNFRCHAVAYYVIIGLIRSSPVRADLIFHRQMYYFFNNVNVQGCQPNETCLQTKYKDKCMRIRTLGEIACSFSDGVKG